MLRRALLPRDYLCLAAVLALAIALRVIGLNAPLWYDEIVTVHSYVQGPWNEILQDYSMNNHYLFTLQAKLSVSVFGDAIWAYRLPAVLFGIGTVLAIWWLARDVAGLAVAHVSALLVALSYHQIWFSQNARGYTELAFWSTLGMILFLRGVQVPRKGIWIAYGLTLAAAVLTHLTGAFFFAAQGLVWLMLVAFLLVRGQLPRDLVISPLLGALAGVLLISLFYGPVLMSLLDTVGNVSQTSAVDLMQEYQNPLWTVLEGLRTAIGNIGILLSLVAIAIVAMAGLGAIGTHRHAPLFAPVIVAHIALTLFLLSMLDMRIWPRFFFADIGFVIILIMSGIALGASMAERLIPRSALGQRVFIVASAAIILVSAAMALRNYSAPKQDLSGAFEFVEQMRGPDDRVYSIGHSGPLFTGYFDADWGNLMSQEDYDTALSHPGTVLLVAPFPARSHRMIPTLRDDTGDSLRLVKRFPGTLGDGDVLVFRRDGHD